MKVNITSRNFHASDSLKETLQEKMDTLQKFNEKMLHGSVTLILEDKNRSTVEILVALKHKQIVCKETDEVMGRAIETCFEKIERQVKKENEKLKSHKSSSLKDFEETEFPEE